MTQINDPLKPILDAHQVAIDSIKLTQRILAFQKISAFLNEIEEKVFYELEHLKTDALKKAGKNPKTVDPQAAYNTLKSIIERIQNVAPLEAISELKATVQEIYCLVKRIKQGYFNDQRLDALEQKIEALFRVLTQQTPDRDKLLHDVTDMKSTIGSVENFMSSVSGLDEKHKKSAKKLLAALREEIFSANRIVEKLTINQ